MNPQSGGTLVVEVEGAVARVRLNRPDQLNALSAAVVTELLAVLAELDGDPSVRVVLFSGAGRMFCAGADLQESAAAMRALDDGTFSAEDALHDAEQGRRLLDAVDAMRPVTTVLIQGAAIGAGTSFAAACDLRVMAAGSRLVLPELALGLPLAWGATARLVRELGPGPTRKLVLAGAPIPAAEALALGFALAVVEPEELDKYGSDLARRIAAYPQHAVGTMKSRITEHAWQQGEIGAGEAELMVAALQHPETIEVMRARLAAVLGTDPRKSL